MQFPLACVPKLLMDSCNGHGQNGFILLLFMAEQDSKLTFDIFIWLAALVKCLVNAYLSYAARLMHVHPSAAASVTVFAVFVVAIAIVVVVICADSLLNF